MIRLVVKRTTSSAARTRGLCRCERFVRHELRIEEHNMSGPIVRTGTTPEFWKNWDQVFGNASKTGTTGKSQPKAAKKAATPKKAAKKSAKKAAKRKK